MPDLLAPLPLRAPSTGAASDGRFVRFDRADPRWAEPLVELTGEGLLAEAWYARTDGLNAPYHAPIAGAVATVAARAGVVARLKAADAALGPRGLRLKTLDAWRPVETQAGLWSYFWDKLARERPELDEAGLEALVRTFVADPRRFDPEDDTTWPIHSTGGSVDVMLVDAGTGAMPDHGAGFDEADERSFTDHYERLLAAGRIAPDDPRLLVRRVLVNAMVNAGFTNYAYEFWHFDYGTQLHVLTLQEAGAAGAPHAAWYGTTRLPAGMA
ncbi:M15 family metallopeptidase [Labrys wisconsinensis]|uniref:D-alanyl-D-alanine dipeptidase n=1 Tax=Labrys wisconsinensis TaxID=425677 RepID=A0ABU0JE97_9HYPH|nr:M15 family metallopeptidase [Labrys wisconsinensis]MDQ0472599.1 D-alanyl-D-alanine dipeptidase [Labrys wisconsinensis]